MPLTVETVEEFVLLASSFWLRDGVEPQVVAFRKGLYDVLGHGVVLLWAFAPAKLQRISCGEAKVIWSDKELMDHIQVGGGYNPEDEQIVWLREELGSMQQQQRSRFLECDGEGQFLPPLKRHDVCLFDGTVLVQCDHDSV